MTLKSKAFDINNRFIVALDGPAASGKGTIGRILGHKLTLAYFQSSIVYRNLALSCINRQITSNNVDAVIELSKSVEMSKNLFSDNENVGVMASEIALIPEVRNNLGVYLVKLIENTPRIIMEGRDIGTVIAPSADLKIFITANILIRAERRFKELQETGQQYTFDQVLKQLKIRDKRDIERNIAPLISSKEALKIDSSYLSPSEVIDKIIQFILIS